MLSKDNFLSSLLERIAALNGQMLGAGLGDRESFSFGDKEASLGEIEELLSRLKAALALVGNSKYQSGRQKLKMPLGVPRYQC